MQEKSCQKKQQHQETIADFYHANPIEIDEERYKQFLLKLEVVGSAQGVLDPSIFHLFDNNADTLAQYAAYSFLNNHISQEQLTTLLLIRTLFKEHAYQCINILDNNGQLTSEASEHLFHFIPLDKKEAFLKRLKFQPCSEACFLKVTLEINDKTDIRLQQFLALLVKDKVITIADKNDTHTTIVMSATGARDAILTCIYGEHAKKSYPIAGKISIETMNSYMQKGIRLINVSYPGIADIIKFHDIAASSLYVSLHDESHRTLISSIPNAVYAALLYAQQVVKETTGIQWSKELWESLDMEIGDFLHRIPPSAEPENVTADFLTVLSSDIYTEARPNGLFHASLFNDTMWLLLIHIHVNLDLWKALCIEPSFFTGSYKIFYDFIDQNSQELKGINPAQQIVLIKSKWLKFPLDLDNPTFVKEGKYIQIEDPKMISKAVLLEHFDFFNVLFSPNDLKPKHRAQFVSNAAEVRNLATLFPQHREVLFCTLFSSPAIFKRLVKDAHDGEYFAKTFSEYRNRLFEALFSSPDDFKRLARSGCDAETLVGAFPEYQQTLFEGIFSSPEDVKRLVSNSMQQQALIRAFPQYTCVFSAVDCPYRPPLIRQKRSFFTIAEFSGNGEIKLATDNPSFGKR